jgi:hypothetical protein
LLSPDQTFNQTGSISKIPYREHFNSYKQLLLKTASNPRVKELYKYYDTYIFSKSPVRVAISMDVGEDLTEALDDAIRGLAIEGSDGEPDIYDSASAAIPGHPQLSTITRDVSPSILPGTQSSTIPNTSAVPRALAAPRASGQLSAPPALPRISNAPVPLPQAPASSNSRRIPMATAHPASIVTDEPVIAAPRRRAAKVTRRSTRKPNNEVEANSEGEA